MRARRRRRKGFDEVRKRELREDLRNYFLNSKNLNYSNNKSNRSSFDGQDYSEAAVSNADYQLNPERQLEKARESNYNFGNIGISSQSPSQAEKINLPSQAEEKTKNQKDKDKDKDIDKDQETENEDNLKFEQEGQNEQKDKDRDKDKDKDKKLDRETSKPEQEEKEEDTSPYSRYQLEQMEREQEEKDAQTSQVQHLVDLPAALESDNRELGHSVKAFADPFLILKELLWMSGRQNPELDVIQRLWLVWTKWYSYYTAWFSVSRDENRFLPGSNQILLHNDRSTSTYQYRGIHQLETSHLESSMLQVMRWEFARKAEMERQFNPMPTVSQLHGYFIGLKRRQWSNSTWQYRVNLGINLTMEEDEGQQMESIAQPPDDD